MGWERRGGREELCLPFPLCLFGVRGRARPPQFRSFVVEKKKRRYTYMWKTSFLLMIISYLTRHAVCLSIIACASASTETRCYLSPRLVRTYQQDYSRGFARQGPRGHRHPLAALFRPSASLDLTDRGLSGFFSPFPRRGMPRTLWRFPAHEILACLVACSKAAALSRRGRR